LSGKLILLDPGHGGQDSGVYTRPPIRRMSRAGLTLISPKRQSPRSRISGDGRFAPFGRFMDFALQPHLEGASLLIQYADRWESIPLPTRQVTYN
jgi:hypothetical protein